MPKKRHRPEEIVAKLGRVDTMISQGRSVADAVRTIGVTSSTSLRTSVWSSGLGLHCSRQPLGERVHRELQRPASRRVARRGRLSNPNQHRRPRSRLGRHSINIPTGPLHGAGQHWYQMPV